MLPRYEAKSRQLWISRAIVFLFVCGLFATASTPVWWYPWMLSRHGVESRGWTIGKEPANHMGIRYQYMVDGTPYEGTLGGYPLNQIQLGDSIRVTYLPDAPQVSRPDLSQTARGWWFLPFVLLPAVAIAAAFGAVRPGAQPAA